MCQAINISKIKLFLRVWKFLTKEKSVPRLFLRPKPVKLLVSLKTGPKYATILSKEVDLTYSHTVKLLDQFKNFGLVDFEKRGRIKIVKLTDVGEDLAKSMETSLIKLSKLKEKISWNCLYILVVLVGKLFYGKA